MKSNPKSSEKNIDVLQPHLQSILENLPNMVFVKNAADLKFVYVNASAEELMGHKRDELLGKSDVDFFPAKQASFFNEKDRKVFEIGEKVDIPEEPIKTPHMGTRILHTKKVPIFDNDGKPLFLLGISEDITELKNTQKKLDEKFYETQNLYHTILENTAEGIITFQKDGTIMSYNKACKGLFGYENFEIIGQNIFQLFSESNYDLLSKKLHRLFNENEESISSEPQKYFAKTKNGSLFPVEFSVSRIVVNNKNICSCIIRDISHKVEADKKIQEYTKKLEISNQELDDFVHIAAHDLKEPLRGIYIYSSLIQEDYHDKLDEKGQEKLILLEKLAHQMEDLINDLMNYSQITRIKLTFDEYELEPVLKNVIDTLSPWLNEHDAKVLIEKDLPKIKCDPLKVAEVFRNLITNGIKYNENSNKLIEIGVKYDLPKWKDLPVFFVKDNGIGIPENPEKDIFKIFTRLHPKKNYEGGTGAGLSIVKKIIQRHGGDIWFQSKPNEGTTFYFSLESNHDE